VATGSGWSGPRQYSKRDAFSGTRGLEYQSSPWHERLGARTDLSSEHGAIAFTGT
jgi:hypothetical protein